MNTITEFQRRMWLVLSYMSLCRYYIVHQNGRFCIKKAGRVRLFFYYTFWLNCLVKVVYMVLAYRQYLPVEVHFLDQMGMWDWFLMFSQLVQETNMWYRMAPMYETLSANWKIQEEIFLRLGSPKSIQQAIRANDRSLVKMHTFIVSFGCIAIGIQFLIAPKYATNIYALIPYDNLILQTLFCIHEVCFIFHIWIHQACSIILMEVFASTYTHILREMTIVFDQLIDLGSRHDQETSNMSRDELRFKRKHTFSRTLDLSRKVPGTEYNLMTLLHDYQKMMLATNSFNSWCGRLMGGIMGSNYSQFVTDVFMMIQLLKEPETDVLAVFFYGEDACAGMWILFRMLIIISRMYPASEEFLQRLKHYSSFDTPVKLYLRKYQRCFTKLSANLGGYKTKSITVPKGINTLFVWYINAALWQRPVDRLT